MKGIWINPGCNYSKKTILLSCIIPSTRKPHHITFWIPVQNISQMHHNNIEVDKQPLYEISQFDILFLICKAIFAYTNSLLSKTIICSWRFFLGCRRFQNHLECPGRQYVPVCAESAASPLSSCSRSCVVKFAVLSLNCSLQVKQKGISASDKETVNQSFTGLERPWGLQKVEAPRFQDSRRMREERLSALSTVRL